MERTARAAGNCGRAGRTVKTWWLRRDRGTKTRQATCQADRLAFDRILPPSEAPGRIRDAFHNYDDQGRSLVRHDTGGARVRPGRRWIIPS
jgi:hypothetical protein